MVYFTSTQIPFFAAWWNYAFTHLKFIWHSLLVIISSLSLVLLHLYLYGWNLYAWQQTRINYAFIFEHRPGTELRYRQVLCVASGFTTLLLAAMNAHLYISTKQAPGSHASEFIPLASVLVWLQPGNTKLATNASLFWFCWSLNYYDSGKHASQALPVLTGFVQLGNCVGVSNCSCCTSQLTV